MSDGLDYEAAAIVAWNREMNTPDGIRALRWEDVDELERSVFLTEAIENVNAALPDQEVYVFDGYGQDGVQTCETNAIYRPLERLGTNGGVPEGEQL